MLGLRLVLGVGVMAGARVRARARVRFRFNFRFMVMVRVRVQTLHLSKRGCVLGVWRWVAGIYTQPGKLRKLHLF